MEKGILAGFGAIIKHVYVTVKMETEELVLDFSTYLDL